MVKCDKCEYEGPKVIMGDHCPECDQLVGFPVPGRNARGSEIEAYDSAKSDEELAVAVKRVAERNYATLLRRKRQAEAAAGLQPEQGSPPNAEPEAAVDPSVQPQPDGEADAPAAEPAEDVDDSEATGV